MQEKYKEETTTGIVERLSERLYKLTRNTNGEALFDQWESDRKAIKQGLNQVGRIFPHYSLHDESHCRTILNNIVMLVGEELIFNLSATDIWLLLSAVYFHDTGMILTNEQEEELIQAGRLAELVHEAQADPQHSMHKQASNFEIDEDQKHLVPKTKYVTKDWTDDYTFLLAELVRRGHATKAGSVIDQNKATDNKNWLRASKLPNRLYEVLKRVCYAHGDDFKAVMALPDEQSGLDTECFHPRFIAAMLRMGDLLDVDHKRFSEVMLAGLSKMPETSVLHMQKHASITQFSIRKKIEIIAETGDPEVAAVTEQWFEWIEQEYKDLALNWAGICNFTNGDLPSFIKAEVILKDYVRIGGKAMPRFEIDTKKAIEYLGISGLYSNPLIAIRELISNALDATKLRAYVENKDFFDTNNPRHSNFTTILARYPIEILINTSNDYRHLVFQIKDNGCGINPEALNSILNIGNSAKIQQYHDVSSAYLKPVGSFGIGLQSVFMLTEHVTIKTKPMSENYSYEIKLNSITKTGKATVKKEINNANIQPGTTISFKINFDKFNVPLIKTDKKTTQKTDELFKEINFRYNRIYRNKIFQIFNYIKDDTSCTLCEVKIKSDNEDLENTKVNTINNNWECYEAIHTIYEMPKNNLDIICENRENRPTYFANEREIHPVKTTSWFNPKFFSIYDFPSNKYLSISRNEINIQGNELIFNKIFETSLFELNKDKYLELCSPIFRCSQKYLNSFKTKFTKANKIKQMLEGLTVTEYENRINRKKYTKIKLKNLLMKIIENRLIILQLDMSYPEFRRKYHPNPSDYAFFNNRISDDEHTMIIKEKNIIYTSNNPHSLFPIIIYSAMKLNKEIHVNYERVSINLYEYKYKFTYTIKDGFNFKLNFDYESHLFNLIKNRPHGYSSPKLIAVPAYEHQELTINDISLIEVIKISCEIEEIIEHDNYYIYPMFNIETKKFYIDEPFLTYILVNLKNKISFEKLRETYESLVSSTNTKYNE